MSSNLDQSMVMSSNETWSQPKQHVCKICQKTFSKRFNLNVHMMIHTGTRPFQCEACDLAFRQKSHLRKHWERTHTTCELCLNSEEDTLIDYHDLKSSSCDHRKAGRANFQHCDSCGKFVSAKKEHLCNGYVRSFPVEQHPCDVCGKSFTRKLSLFQHQRVHTKEKPYLCQVCGKTFAYNSALNMHGQVHRDEKRYVCERAGCSKVYGRRSDLLRHVKRKHS